MVLPLWSLPDKTSKELMSRFYRLLADPTVWARHSHILWVDADAVVIAPDSPLGPLLALGALPAGGSSRCLAARALQPRPHGRLTAELPFGRAGRPI